jgi:hypothetical protein
VLLPSDTHRKPITSITAVLLPFVTYLLTLPLFMAVFVHNAENVDLKVCVDSILIQLLCFWALSIGMFLFKTQHFGDWILSPSSGGTYSVGPN